MNVPRRPAFEAAYTEAPAPSLLAIRLEILIMHP
jgi:hypothetical protein